MDDHRWDSEEVREKRELEKAMKRQFLEFSESEDSYSVSRSTFLLCLFMGLVYFIILGVFLLFLPLGAAEPGFPIVPGVALLDDDSNDVDYPFSRMVEEAESLLSAGLRRISLPGGESEVVLRMPFPEGVDESIRDSTADACHSFSTHMCGSWKGYGDGWLDRAFGSASRDAERRLEMILNMEAAQFSRKEGETRDERSLGAGGAFHDMVLSCISSLLDVDGDSNLDYARNTLLRFSPSNASAYSAAYLGGYALGVSTAYGDQPGVRIDTTMNPISSREALVEFGTSSQLSSYLMIDSNVLADAMDGACRTLMAVELYPWDKWNNQGQCADALYATVSSVLRETQNAQRTAPVVTWSYFSKDMVRDLYTQDAWYDLVGRDFGMGIEDGMLAGMHTFAQVLEEQGLTVPDLRNLRKWTRYGSLIRYLGTLAAADPTTFIMFVRAMFVIDNGEYENALLRDVEPGSAFASRVLSSRSHGTPAKFSLLSNHPNHEVDMRAWRITRHTGAKSRRIVQSTRETRKKAERSRDADTLLGDDPLAMSSLLRADAMRRCAWLSMEFLPAETDNSVARSAVSERASMRVHELFDWVRSAMVADIASSRKITAEGKRVITGKLRAIRARVAVPWDGEGTPPVSVPYDVDPDAPFVRNARQARARQTVQAMIETARSHDMPPAQRPSLSHTFEVPTSAVNAYYDPATNQIVFLAGILVPPFFSTKYSDATQLATLGAIIGHELAHAFDEMGKHFNADGSVTQLLPPEVEAGFDTAELCFVKQYEKTRTPHDNRVDGRRTLSENMADVMGLRAAFRALVGRYPSEGVPVPVQREFVEAYAQMWCSSANKTVEAERATVDVHAPGPARIHGALRNLVAPDGSHVMHTVYGCPVDSVMNPTEVCSMW